MDGGNGMNRRDFLRSAGMAGAGLLWGVPAYAAGAIKGGVKRPNIVLIVADDLGYADIGAQGCADVPTPHIDSIAANGVRFTNGYVSCPVCSPTRAGLNTGRYQQRFGHEFNPGPPRQADPNFGLPLTEKTMAQRLKTLGYRTALVGKWHLGYRPEFHPMQRGFDEFYGFLGGAHDYFKIEDQAGQFILRGTEPVVELAYTTDNFAQEAVSFIDRTREEPFFLYLAFNAVHTPLQAPDKYRQRFEHITDEKRRTMAAMLSAMDDGIGGVLAKLRDRGIEDDTVIFFISDNGGPTQTNASKNNPLRGYKGNVLEGGIRVPFLCQWKSEIPAGQVDDRPVISLDILPTLLAAAKAETEPERKLDGVDLIPYLKRKHKKMPHEALYWRFGEQWAVRMNEWKLLSMQGDPPQLYNLEQDIGESENLAQRYPDRVDALKAAYDAWNAKNVAPKWARRAGQPPGRSQRPRRRARM